MFGMSESGTLTVLAGIGAAVSTAVAWIFKYILGGKDAQIARLEAEVAARQAENIALRDQQLEAIRAALAEARKGSETNAIVARSVAELSASFAKLSGAAP